MELSVLVYIEPMYRNDISHPSRVWRNTSHYSLIFSLSYMVSA